MMDIAAQQGYREAGRPEVSKTAKVIAGGSIGEGLAGAAAIVLSILGLVGVYPDLMAAVATIAFGVALLIGGGAISSRVRTLMEESTRSNFDMAEVGGGLTAEFLAGIAGVVLGVLALFGILPQLLLAIAVIVFGGALVVSSSTTQELNYIAASRYENETARMVAREAVGAAGSLQLLFGIGAIIMGILALVDQPQAIFTLIGLLTVGTAGLFSGTAITGRMTSLFRRR
jgi:hypothetical protein